MAVTMQKRCDHPGCDSGDCTTYAISSPTETRQVDLCEKHAVPLVKIAGYGAVHSQKGNKFAADEAFIRV